MSLKLGDFSTLKSRGLQLWLSVYPSEVCECYSHVCPYLWVSPRLHVHDDIVGQCLDAVPLWASHKAMKLVNFGA